MNLRILNTSSLSLSDLFCIFAKTVEKKIKFTKPSLYLEKKISKTLLFFIFNLTII